MAATKRKRAVKPATKPERDVTTTTASGKTTVDPIKLAAFKKALKNKGIAYPKVRFIARNAPFMRKSPV